MMKWDKVITIHCHVCQVETSSCFRVREIQDSSMMSAKLAYQIQDSSMMGAVVFVFQVKNKVVAGTNRVWNKNQNTFYCL